MENDYITYDEFKKISIYQDFIDKNPDLGYLKIKAFTAQEAIPVVNTEVIITKDIGSYKVIFYRGKTDINGMINNIVLPAPKHIKSTSNETPEYTLYELNALREGYEAIKEYQIGMLGNVKVIQYIKMVPIIEVIPND